jgi:hypothetical protein
VDHHFVERPCGANGQERKQFELEFSLANALEVFLTPFAAPDSTSLSYGD